MAGERSVGELLDELFGFESVAKRQAALRASLPYGLLTGMSVVLRALRLHTLASRRALLVRCGWSVAMLPFCVWRTRPSCWSVWSRRLRLSR